MPNGFFLALAMILVFLILGILLSGLINLLIPLFRTPKKDMKNILNAMDIQDDDVFIDLGSGDARVIFDVRKRNKKAMLYGYEISPILLMIGKIKKYIMYPLDRKIVIEAENLFDIDYSKATKIYCYLSPEALKILRGKFKRIGKELKIYSYKYQIPDMKFKKKFELESKEYLYMYEF
jgi:hypothetical protein